MQNQSVIVQQSGKSIRNIGDSMVTAYT